MAELELTPNSMIGIISSNPPDKPVVQVLGIKKISNNDANKLDRFRLQISDGTNKQPSAMLGTQLNHLVTENLIQKNGIIRLDKYLCNVISNRRIVIILGLEVLSPDIGHVIGNPVTLREEDVANVATGATASPQKGAPGSPAAAPPAPAAAPATAPAVASVVAKKSPENQYARLSAASRSAPAARSSASDHYNPVTMLNPYGRWTICVRVTSKSPIREWKNDRGSGKLFSVDLLDSHGELRATGFNESVDKLYDKLEVGKTYVITGGKVKQANKKYTHIKNDYELSFDDSTEVELTEADNSLPKYNFSFESFANFEKANCGQGTNVFVDVIGIVKDVGTLSTITIRSTNQERSKMDVQLMDKTGLVINLTLWGKEAEDFEKNGGAVGVVLVAKTVRLSDYGGRSLSGVGSSVFLINPDLPEAHALAGWYEREGSDVSAKKLTVRQASGGEQRIDVSAIKELNLGADPVKADRFAIKGMVTYIKKENCLYKACPGPECKKKVVENGGKYSCEKCKTDYDTFVWRMMALVGLSDATGQVYVTCFQDQAEMLVGTSAQELGEMREKNEGQFNQLLNDANFKTWIFSCRAKTETYNEESRVKTTAVSVGNLDFREENKRMIEQIKSYNS
eukprot:m.22292 g.22292  ORF g.22292 m.22292 type:complete len:626 (+) comp10867_c0_seq1:86-1963(+)